MGTSGTKIKYYTANPIYPAHIYVFIGLTTPILFLKKKLLQFCTKIKQTNYSNLKNIIYLTEI